MIRSNGVQIQTIGSTGISGNNIPLTRFIAPGGGWHGNPVLTVAEDAQAGIYIQSLGVGQLIARFAPTPICSMTLWHVANHATTTLMSGADMTCTVDTDSATGVIFIEIMPIGISGISLNVIGYPTAEGYFFTQSITNTNTTYAVQQWEFPRLGCTPSNGNTADARIAHGYIGGQTIGDPHGFSCNVPSPSSMQYWSYFNTQDRLHVYVSTEDDVGYAKRWTLTGSDAMALQTWTHYPKNGRKAQNGGVTPQVLTYNLNLLVFHGNTQDGRLGAFDAALRYRDWATDAARPWMSRGPWAASVDVSSRVKNTDWYYTMEVPEGASTTILFSGAVEDAKRIADFIGATESMMLWNGWSQNQVGFVGPPTFRPPAFYPFVSLADQIAALTAAESRLIHVSLYTIPHPWDTTLTSTPGLIEDFAFTLFKGTSQRNISNLVIKDEANNVLTAESLAYFDLSQNRTIIEEIIGDLFLYDQSGFGSELYGYYKQSPAHPIQGFYWDLWSGGEVFLNYATALSPNGNNGTWESNKVLISQNLKTRMLGQDSSFYFTSENTEEYLIPAFDVMHTQQGVADPLFGTFDGMFSVIYSRYQCLMDFRTVLNETAFLAIPSSQWQFYLTWVTFMFHETGGHIGLRNGQDFQVVPVNPPTFFNCPLYPLLLGLKRIIDRLASNTALKSYMREGLRMRPLPSHWHGDYIDSGETLPSFLAQQGTAVLNSSSVWKNVSTSEIGIVLTSSSTADEVVNIYMEAEAYDLDPFRPYTLFRNIDGVRTEVTRFVGTLDEDVTLVFDGNGGAVDLYEVVPSV